KNRPDDSYQPVGTAGYYALSVTDPTNWKTWPIQGRTVVIAAAQEGLVFPNPFRADGSSAVSITGHGASAMLRVYDSSMRLVYGAQTNSTALPDKTVYHWSGRTNDGRLAASGIYFFTLEFPDATITGKLALLRNGP
ncbi:MAG TPA: T9SS type A sorting domain-containing protein, partial [Bacteroidota bacterium]